MRRLIVAIVLAALALTIPLPTSATGRVHIDYVRVWEYAP